MKIERDKKYRTRAGEVRRVICTDAPGKYPIISMGFHHAEGYQPWMHSLDGRYGTAEQEHDFDLIAEVREPREWWLYSTRCNGWFVYDNRLGLGLTDKGEWVRVREVIEP